MSVVLGSLRNIEIRKVANTWCLFVYLLFIVPWAIFFSAAAVCLSLFYAPLKNFSLIWKRHHYRWRAAQFRFMLGAQGLWARRDIYRATPAVTRGIGFSGLIRRTAPFNRLLRHTRGCGGPILTGPHSRLIRHARRCWGPILTRIPAESVSIENTCKKNYIEKIYL
jgi:hypothetical protein